MSKKIANNISSVSLLKALADEVRLRIIRLLSREELNVQELEQILQIPQPSVSRNLGILKQNGFVNDRREGTRSFYTINALLEDQALATYIQQLCATDHPDIERLEECMKARVDSSLQFNNEIAQNWESISNSLYDNAATMMTIAETSGKNEVVLDLGTGTGTMLPYLSVMSNHVYAVDHSSPMLMEARERCKKMQLNNISFMQIPIEKIDGRLPLSNKIILHFVLHQSASPGKLLTHISKFLDDNGKIIIADSLPHDDERKKARFASNWFGFSKQQIINWAESANLKIEKWYNFENSQNPSFVAVITR